MTPQTIRGISRRARWLLLLVAAAALAQQSIKVDVNEVIVPVTAGRLDLGPWQRIFYGEWDGQRPKRVILKAMGD